MKTCRLSLRALVVAAATTILQFSINVQGRSTSNSIPIVAQYEFLADPIVHRFGTHNSETNTVRFSKRSFNQQLDLASMIDDGTFHVQLRAFNTTYSLVVEPNHDLIHPDAVLTQTLETGQVVKTPIPTHDIGVYRGHVLRVGAVQPQQMSESLRKWEMSKRDQFSFDEKSTWVRLSVFLDAQGRAVLDGMFGVDGETFYVKPAAAYARTKRDADPALSNPLSRRSEELRFASSIVYRQSDLVNEDDGHSHHQRKRRRDGSSAASGAQTCGAHRLTANTPEMPPRLEIGDPLHPVRMVKQVGDVRGLLTKRATAFDNSPDALNAGCISARKVLYMGAAADCSYVTQYQSQDGARQQILSNWNQASAVYERQLNVALGLIKLQIEQLTCPTVLSANTPWNRGCSDGYAIDSRLSDFSTWRAAQGDDGCGLWHLMTNCPTGTEVGLAWLGTMCMTTSSTNTAQGGVSSGTGVSAVSRDEWKVVAHEIGHNFGASHDCTSSNCPCSGSSCDQCCPCSNSCDCNAMYIMNPTSPVSSDNFSPCSIKDMCGTIKSTGLKCLQDPGKRATLSAGMCGNGIKEKGEECDCGTSEECKNDPCCDASTCKLKAGAMCADVNDLCCDKCKVVSQGTVCRPKYSDCDIAEICDGSSADCPEDKHIKDGDSCGTTGAGLTCASGQCTSRDAQCAARGGSSGLTKRCTISMGGDLCDFQCSDPNNPLVCVYMSGSFIDGSDCGFHARCRSGKCKGDNAFYQFLLLFQRNLAISVPVTIAVALAILTIICCCCCRCFACCGYARRRVNNKYSSSGRDPTSPSAVADVGNRRPGQRGYKKIFRRKTLDPATVFEPTFPDMTRKPPQPPTPSAQNQPYGPYYNMPMQPYQQPYQPNQQHQQNWVNDADYNGFGTIPYTGQPYGQTMLQNTQPMPSSGPRFYESANAMPGPNGPPPNEFVYPEYPRDYQMQNMRGSENSLQADSLQMSDIVPPNDHNIPEQTAQHLPPENAHAPAQHPPVNDAFAPAQHTNRPT